MTSKVVPIAEIVSAGNIRRDVGDVTELANSIREVGLLEPLVVRAANGSYELLAGHRRLAAIQSIGDIDEVEVVVREFDGLEGDTARLIVQLVENLQRHDLDLMEEAQGYAQLRALGLKQADIARKVGRSAGHVSKRLAVLELPDEIAAHAEELTSESLYEISKAAKAGADLTAIAKNLDAGRNDPRTIEVLTERAVKHAEGMKKVNERVAELEAQGVRVLPAKYDDGGYPTLPKDRIGYGGFLGNVAQDDHANEPCHAICVYLQWGSDVVESAHCTDRRRHEPDGSSVIKIPTSPDRRKAGEVSQKRVGQVAAGLDKATAAAIARTPSRDVVQARVLDKWYELVTEGGYLRTDPEGVLGALGGPEDADPDLWIHEQYTKGDAKAKNRILWALYLSAARVRVSVWSITESLSRRRTEEFDELVALLTELGFPPNLDDPGEEE